MHKLKGPVGTCMGTPQCRCRLHRGLQGGPRFLTPEAGGEPQREAGEEGTGSFEAPDGGISDSCPSVGLSGLLLQCCRSWGEWVAARHAPEVPETHGFWGHWLPADLRTSYKIKSQRGRQDQT
jgi:hypothetical protein